MNQKQFLDALTDFGPDRNKTWRHSKASYLVVHSQTQHSAVVTEGSRIFGGVWEKLHYNWSDPKSITLKTLDSNLWATNSYWQYQLQDLEDGSGTLITHTITRFPKNLRSRLVIILVATFLRQAIKRDFEKTLQLIEKSTGVQYRSR